MGNARLSVKAGHFLLAAYDFGGHRVAAIGALDGALKQLEVALKHDKN
jgi:hypothetical protein